MSGQEVTVGLKIEGDGSGGIKAAQDTGAALDDLTPATKRAEQAANALDSAFKTLGVKPMKEVHEEAEKLRAALATIKAAGIIGVDQERAIAAFNEKLAALRKEVVQIPNATASATAGLSNIASSANSASAALGGAAKSAALALTALAGLNSIGDIAKDVINTGAAFETLEIRLTSLLGSSAAAKEAMGQIKQLAITTPFEVSALSESFTKLTAFGLRPSMEQMRALADTAATLGGGTEVLSGVTLALGQAWSKGKLQGEEIMQLAERGVPVWDALAQATGKNTAELQKMSAAGELGRDTILKLIDALGQFNAGASEKLMSTFSGAVSNAKDALSEFYDMVAQAGVLEFLTNQLQDLLTEFDRMKESGELQAEAQRLADAFIAFGEAVRTAVEAVHALSGTIKLGVEVWAAWRLAGMTLIPVLAGVGRQAAVTAAETTAMAAASETAAVGMGRLAWAIRLLKGLTLVGLIEGVISLGAEFFRAKKEAEDSDRAIKKMFEQPPVNGPKEAIKTIVTETEAARFKLTEYQRAMSEMLGLGKTTGDALADMVKKGNFSTTQGVGEFLNGMESIRASAQATGEQIRVSLQERFNKMSGEDLRAFGIMAETAFNRGEISAGQLSAVLNGTVDAALKQLGSSIQTFAGGMTSGFIEAIQQAGVVENSFSRLKDSGQDAGAILKDAFSGALNVAKSIKDFEGLEVAIKASGEAGRLSKIEVSEFLDKIREKVDDLKPGINSLAEAFRTLGMKSPEELRKAAVAAEAAFNVIKRSGDYSAAGINNAREAFRRYAEAAIAANGGVASEMIKAQAWVNGFAIEVDKSGRAMIAAAESASAMDQGVGSVAEVVREAGDAAADAADDFDGLSSAMGRASAASSTGVRGPQGGGQGASSQSYVSSGDSTHVMFDPRQEAIKAGATIDNVDEVVRLIQFEIERLQAANRNQVPQLRDLQDLPRRMLLELSARQPASSESPAESSSSRQRTQSDAITRAGRQAQGQTFTVKLDLGGGRTKSTGFSSARDAESATAMLRSLEEAARSSR